MILALRHKSTSKSRLLWQRYPVRQYGIPRNEPSAPQGHLRVARKIYSRRPKISQSSQLWVKYNPNKDNLMNFDKEFVILYFLALRTSTECRDSTRRHRALSLIWPLLSYTPSPVWTTLPYYRYPYTRNCVVTLIRAMKLSLSSGFPPRLALQEKRTLK